MKKCSRCRIEEEETEFAFQNTKNNKRMSACKECMNLHQRNQRKVNPDKTHFIDKLSYERNKERKILYAREYRKKYPDRTRTTNLKTKYGINKDEYDEKLKEQDFKCAICKKGVSNNRRAFCVDHNHTTGKIRGLLCDGCNRGLGYYEIWLKEYIKYLEIWNV